MAQDNNQGSIVLEKLAALGLVDAFYEAVDDDNMAKAVSLMRKAQVDEETIELTLKAMQEG